MQIAARENPPKSHKDGAEYAEKASSEQARKQLIEADMQARRMGRSVVREGLRAADTAEPLTAAAQKGREEKRERIGGTGDHGVRVHGGGGGVRRVQGSVGFETTWEDEPAPGGSTDEGGLLSCTSRGSAGTGSLENRQSMQTLLRAAWDQRMPLNACLFGASAAFGLASGGGGGEGTVVYVAQGETPQILALREIESVSTDSQGKIVFLGPERSAADGASGAAVGRAQQVLLRGCQMSAFDLDAMTSFFERVQEIIAGLEMSS